jgi:hypothetical protein
MPRPVENCEKAAAAGFFDIEKLVTVHGLFVFSVDIF